MGLTKGFFLNSIMFIFCVVLVAQNKSSDSLFVNALENKISVRINASTDIQKYKTKDSEGQLILKPNEEIRTSVFVDYKWLGFSFGFTPKVFSINNDDDKKGASSFFNIGFRFKINKWIQGITFEKVEGFFVENTGDFVPNHNTSQPFIQFPNLNIKTYGGFTSYVFNNRFSLAAIDGYYKRQLQSAGSFIPRLEYDWTILKNRIEDSTDTSREINLSVLSSYYYTFVKEKKWFAGFGLSAGINQSFSKFETEDLTTGTKITEKSNPINFLYKGRFNLGYNTNTFYGGLNYNFDNLARLNNKIESLAISRSYFQFYIGYRFNAPKSIQKPFNWLDDKMK